MPDLKIPNNASIHTLKNFLGMNAPFCDCMTPAVLKLHPNWAHMDPMALAMSAAWGGWCQRNGLRIEVENMAGPHILYAARMRLFQHLDVPHYGPEEHEEAGRFLPLERIRTHAELAAVIASISALLHLDTEPDGLAAVQYCVSELIRNVLEHSGSTEGAYVCAQRYTTKNPKRVSIAVADCGSGISQHLGQVYPQALKDNQVALSMAMRMGITGARRDGMYGGSPDNAGAGLFITRAIAKATGGYFVLLSGDAVFRQRREHGERHLFIDAFDDPRGDKWKLGTPWQGTVAAVEIVTEKIPDFQDFFKWIRQQLPATKTKVGKIKFT